MILITASYVTRVHNINRKTNQSPIKDDNYWGKNVLKNLKLAKSLHKSALQSYERKKKLNPKISIQLNVVKT